MIFTFFYKILAKISLRYSYFKKKHKSRILLQLINEKGSVGENVTIGNNVEISGVENLIIGNNVSIGTGAFIRADGGLTIGDNVIISRNLVLYTNSHNYEGNCIPFDDTHIDSPIVIEDNVWIGMNVTISPGTHIGEGSIIGLGTRLYGNVPKLSIVGSQSPKIIKTRNKNHYNETINKQLFGDKDGKLL